MKVERPAKETEYQKLLQDSQQTIGITHHSTGLGKLKIADIQTGIEFSVPITDINSKPLSDWRIDQR